MQILLSECRTLTPVAVAVKLSVDLNTSLLRPQDQLGKLSSSVFLYTVMGNSMPSIGATENKDMLINTVAYFKGVIEFDSDLVSSLDSEETPNSWALPLVTLTSIAISPPGIDHNSTKQLRRTVQEGLMYVRKVESKFDAQKELMAIKKAAETVCLRVDLNHKWLDVDLHKMSVQGKTREK
ncbi:hypothetical protein LguiB_028710 [Lonicera macranthoides]